MVLRPGERSILSSLAAFPIVLFAWSGLCLGPGPMRAAGNYTEFYLTDGSTALTATVLSAWSERLPDAHFARIHCSAVVNVERVTEVEREATRMYIVHIEGWTDPLSMSRRRTAPSGTSSREARAARVTCVAQSWLRMLHPTVSTGSISRWTVSVRSGPRGSYS